MPDALDDQRERLLVEQIPRDPTAFRNLYDLYFGRVYSYVAAKVNDPLDAEDLVSDIFLQVVKCLPQFKNQHPFSFAAWVFTIARNTVTDFYRRQGRTFDGLQWETLDNEPDGIEFDHALIEQEQAAELNNMMKLLPERRREVMLLKYFSGLRNNEIAQILHLDERTVASHLSRGLKDLYEAYAKKRSIERNNP
ncbi:MAG: RNA polymerase sigma factor [Chloroflexi bacterium]|nr:RNA polymerase sigma factor [Chloroflexota bacterium]MCC6896609.1 RNA polymerase sigma factor [Anaerolineae bacterium]